MTDNGKTLLIGTYKDDVMEFEYSMDELKNLALSCNLDVIGQITQKIKIINPATFIGLGKVEEIKEYVKINDIEIVVMNDDLSPSQTRNVQDIIGCRVIDRTMLILDIFAQRAKTSEAILQVEIAQLKYLLPRISLVSGDFNERLGMRGPGETKYELDRRKILKQISILEEELIKLVSVRKTQRRRRNKNEIPVIAIVGYTNAGKSTLMNSLIKYSITDKEKQVFVEDMLFATLETTTRQILLPNNKKFLLIDTVGFVSRLPHQLIKAFRSTLEEVTKANLILNVVDISNQDYNRQIFTTETVLKELGVKEVPIINIYNKIDKFDGLSAGEGIYISAARDENIEDLINEINKHLFNRIYTVKLNIPYTKGNLYNFFKEKANILDEKYENEGIKILVELDEELYNKYNYLIIE